MKEFGKKRTEDPSKGGGVWVPAKRKRAKKKKKKNNPKGEAAGYVGGGYPKRTG